MTGRKALRHARRVPAAVGVTAIAIPASATALAEAATTNQSSQSQAADSSLTAQTRARTLAYGHDVILRGHASAAQAGQLVVLQFAAAGGAERSWRTIASSHVHGNGWFRLAAPLRRSGAVRVRANWQAPSQATTTTTTSTTTTTVAAATAAQDTGQLSSAPQHVNVAARLRLRPRTLAVLGAGDAYVRGHLEPGGGGRRVRLQASRDGRWETIAIAHTGRRGGFALRVAPSSTGSERLRVQFAGDRINAPVEEQAGSATVYTQSLASWYEDGGTTACGFHAHYGVANVSLPCGTKVAFSYGGRTVNAVVDDRGPYAGGRRWDLNQNTASALHFSGVGTVWSSQ